MKSTKILICKEEIKEYLGISDHIFRRYVALGMPARYEEGGGWVAYTENIDKWFQVYTKISMKKMLDVEEQRSEVKNQKSAYQ